MATLENEIEEVERMRLELHRKVFEYMLREMKSQPVQQKPTSRFPFGLLERVVESALVMLERAIGGLVATVLMRKRS